MEVTFELKHRDQIYFWLWGMLHSPIIIGMWIVFVALTSWLLIRLVSQRGPATDMVHTVANIIAFFIIEGGLIVLLFGFQLLVRILGTCSKGNRKLLTEYTVTLSDENLLVESIRGKMEIPWQAVHKVRKTGHYLLVYTSGDAAVPVPRASFRSPDDFEKFFDFARQRVSG